MGKDGMDGQRRRRAGFVITVGSMIVGGLFGAMFELAGCAAGAVGGLLVGIGW